MLDNCCGIYALLLLVPLATAILLIAYNSARRVNARDAYQKALKNKDGATALKYGMIYYRAFNKTANSADIVTDIAAKIMDDITAGKA